MKVMTTIRVLLLLITLSNYCKTSSPEIIRQQQRANEEYQRTLREYLKNFRKQQKAISDRFEETYKNLLIEVEEKNKTNFLEKVENLADTVIKENARNQETYQKFDKLKTKLRNDWMFPKI